MALLNLIFFIGLIMIFFQDFKDREVHVSFFIIIFFTSLIFFYVKNNRVIDIIYSSLFLICIFLFLSFYFFLRKISTKGFFIGGLALGDVLFLLIVIPFFKFFDYIFYFVTGMFFSLISHFLMKMKIDKRNTVPLAGYLSLYLIFIHFLKINFVDFFI